MFINLVTPKARAKHEPLVQQTGHCRVQTYNLLIKMKIFDENLLQWHNK